MFAGQNQLFVLIEYGDSSRYEALCPLWLKIGNLQRRVKGVACVNFVQKFARQLGKSDERLADEMRKQGGSWGRERQHLKPVDDRR